MKKLLIPLLILIFTNVLADEPDSNSGISLNLPKTLYPSSNENWSVNYGICAPETKPWGECDNKFLEVPGNTPKKIYAPTGYRIEIQKICDLSAQTGYSDRCKAWYSQNCSKISKNNWNQSHINIINDSNRNPAWVCS